MVLSLSRILFIFHRYNEKWRREVGRWSNNDENRMQPLFSILRIQKRGIHSSHMNGKSY